jgi:hypothetical protein
MSWVCPHCNTAAALRDGDLEESNILLKSRMGHKRYTTTGVICPNPDCQNHVVIVKFAELTHYKGELIETGRRGGYRVFPQGTKTRSKDYPDYIPAVVLDDYRESCGIVELSPKASATLARRCLQGMIRDFWGVKADTLFKEIQAIEDKVDPVVWEAIEGVRKVGNIGAHMEKDINLIVDVSPEEADLLIEMIEMLLDDWYVARHEKQQKLQRIKEVAAEKAEARKG